MSEPVSRPLRVFLCHSSDDKPTVRKLYDRLNTERWMDIWLDEKKLLPGQDWDYEIEKALDNSDAVIVTLSTGSVSKEGYVQKELRFMLEIALEKPEGTIFILPIRLDGCERPRRLRSIQGIDYFPKGRRTIAYQRLLESLRSRAASLGVPTISQSQEKARDEAEESTQKENLEVLALRKNFLTEFHEAWATFSNRLEQLRTSTPGPKYEYRLSVYEFDELRENLEKTEFELDNAPTLFKQYDGIKQYIQQLVSDIKLISEEYKNQKEPTDKIKKEILYEKRPRYGYFRMHREEFDHTFRQVESLMREDILTSPHNS